MLCSTGKRSTSRDSNCRTIHPQSPQYGGDPGDNMVLDENDVLRPYEGPEPKLKLNRAERRRAGWRGTPA